jgi:hypothetical protein
MRSAQRVRLLAILLAAISTRLLASSAPLRINESEMSAVISERFYKALQESFVEAL